MYKYSDMYHYKNDNIKTMHLIILSSLISGRRKKLVLISQCFFSSFFFSLSNKNLKKKLGKEKSGCIYICGEFNNRRNQLKYEIKESTILLRNLIIPI